MEEVQVEETKPVEKPTEEKTDKEKQKKPVIVQVKDIIFSFRHMYLENLQKLNKKLKKHISIDSPLIDDVTMYMDYSKYRPRSIKAKFRFKKRSFGRVICNLSEALGKESYLRYPSEIKKDEYGNYVSTKGIKIKSQKIAREIECILKEEFYNKINGYFNNGKISISFTGYDITISCSDFIICYDCVGDIIYVYTSMPYPLEDILNTKIDLDMMDDYHKKNVSKEERIIDTDSYETNKDYPGDYAIQTKEGAIVLKRLKKGKLNKYI